MMNLVDTHCHIQSAGVAGGERGTRELWAKAPDLIADTIVANAVASGVTQMICVGCDLADSRLAVDFVQGREQCWASIGIHPHEAQHFTDEAAWQDFALLAKESKVIAIGECGLDYYYNHSPKSAQIQALRKQIELAQQYDLPLIFHVREAFDDFWPIFDSYSTLRGVLHSFTDTAVNLAKALDRNLYIGVNGIATFTKDTAQLEVYRSIPSEKLLLETDAPFLTPHPYRGSINEPKRVRDVAEFLAKLRKGNLESVAAATTDNARKLFGI